MEEKEGLVKKEKLVKTNKSNRYSKRVNYSVYQVKKAIRNRLTVVVIIRCIDALTCIDRYKGHSYTLKAVQTLSRLNRITSGKEDAFFLDFVNTKEEIEKAFKPYNNATIPDKIIIVNLIYDTQIMLRDARLYNDGDIDSFIRINYKDGKQTATDLGHLTSLMKPVIDRYADLSEEDQFELRKMIRNFNKWYAYLIQITRMYDNELHKEYVFTSYLQKFLPRPEIISLDLDDKLKLEFYKLE